MMAILCFTTLAVAGRLAITRYDYGQLNRNGAVATIR